MCGRSFLSCILLSPDVSFLFFFFTAMEEFSSNATNQTSPIFPVSYRVGLVVLYTPVLLGGSVGIVLMSTSLKSSKSVTTVSVINLLVVHLLFLLTVPFRIYYFISDQWALGLDFCKLVSSMIHAHVYLSFIFYIVILVTRFLNYFQWRGRLKFTRVLHAFVASLTVWVIILGTLLPATIINYGSEATTGEKRDNVCFHFGSALSRTPIVVLNYIICVVVLLVCTVLASIQLWILRQVYRKYGRVSLNHQEFWAQLKSLCFVLIMFFCFVPYHGFRIYYVSSYWDGLQKVNEVFLAFTAFTCFDMLMFAGRAVCRRIE
uniref:Si:dkey-94e7.1 n=1 Tax=Astyanax mexicanus TaxID=7994 RepID=A0A8B9LKJ2_ASTMX